MSSVACAATNANSSQQQRKDPLQPLHRLCRTVMENVSPPPTWAIPSKIISAKHFLGEGRLLIMQSNFVCMFSWNLAFHFLFSKRAQKCPTVYFRVTRARTKDEFARFCGDRTSQSPRSSHTNILFLSRINLNWVNCDCFPVEIRVCVRLCACRQSTEYRRYTHILRNINK